MNNVKMLVRSAILVFAVSMLGACAPEVGSEEWCTSLKEKPKGDWSGNEAVDFAKHCVFK